MSAGCIMLLQGRICLLLFGRCRSRMHSDFETLQDFGGRAVLIVRNPYAAILSDHNFIYAGHHGSAPLDNFERRGNVRNMCICCAVNSDILFLLMARLHFSTLATTFPLKLQINAMRYYVVVKSSESLGDDRLRELVPVTGVGQDHATYVVQTHNPKIVF